jgi:hypothetical protein
MSAPLLDLPAWRLERLTLCGVRDVNLYRTALTHRLALPQELRLEKVGCPAVSAKDTE